MQFLKPQKAWLRLLGAVAAIGSHGPVLPAAGGLIAAVVIPATATAQNMVPTGEATISVTGRGVGGGSSIEMIITDIDGLSQTLNSTADGAGNFSFNNAVIEDPYFFNIGMTLPYAQWGGGGATTLNLRYDEEQDIVIITIVSAPNTLLRYRIPGDATDRVATAADGRFNISIPAELIFAEETTGLFNFQIGQNNNNNNNGGVIGWAINTQPIEVSLDFSEILAPEPVTPTGGGYNPAVVAGLAGVIAGTWGSALKDMTDQFSSTMIAQMQNIGGMIDSNQTIDTQRKLQVAKSNATNMARPSPQMCEIASLNQGRVEAESNAKVTRSTVQKSLTANNRAVAGTRGSMLPYARSQMRFNNIMESGVTDPSANGVSGFGETRKAVNDDTLYNMHVDAYNQLQGPSVLKNVNYADDVQTKEEESMNYFLDNLVGQDYPIVENYNGYGMASVQASDSVVNDVIATRIAEKSASHNPENTELLKNVLRGQNVSEDNITATYGNGASLDSQDEILSQMIIYDKGGVIDSGEDPVKVEQQRLATMIRQLKQDYAALKKLQQQQQVLALTLEAELQQRQKQVEGRILQTVK